MSTNCLFTKIKTAVNNNSLEKYGILEFEVKNNEGEQTYLMLNWYGTISINTPEGKPFSIPTLNVNNVTHWEGESGSTIKGIQFSTGDYKVEIGNKYGLEQIYIEPASGRSAIAFNLDDINSSLVNLTSLTLVKTASYGNIKNVPMITKYYATDNTTPRVTVITGLIEDLGESINLTDLNVRFTNVRGEIKNFVSRQISAGRLTCDGINMIDVLNYAKFNGNLYNEQGCYKLTWESADKIILYYMVLNSSTDYTKVYAYGATAEEIAAWEQAGKTVVVVE